MRIATAKKIAATRSRFGMTIVANEKRYGLNMNTPTVSLSTHGILTPIAIAVATPAAFSDSHRACCMLPSWIVGENQCVVKPAIGQLCTFDLLNA